MKTPILVLAFALTLSACGASSSLTSGSYTLTNISFSQKDTCHLVEIYPENIIGDIEVSGDSIKIFTKTTDPVKNETNPFVAATGTIADGKISATVTSDGDNNHNPASDPSFNCIEHIIKTVSGTVTSDTVFDATLQWDISTNGASGCTEANLLYTPPTCTSIMTFTATKK
jgi:hypothetical protein